MSDPIDVGAQELAIQAWVVEGSGLPGNHVIWSDTGQSVPTKPYITLAIIADAPIGLAELATEDADDPQIGAEINHVVRTPSRVTLSIQCYQLTADATGRRTALAILRNVAAQRYVPDTADALAAAGVGVAGFTGSRAVGAVINAAKFEPRCVMEATITVIGELRSPATYIQTAEITNDTRGETFQAPAQTPAVGSAAGTSTASGTSG